MVEDQKNSQPIHIANTYTKTKNQKSKMREKTSSDGCG